MPLEEADIEQIKGLIGEGTKAGLAEVLVPTINKALDARLKGVVKAEDLEKFKAEQAEAAAKSKEKEKETETDGGGDGSGDPTDTPAYRKAMAEIEALKQSAQAEREARQAAERQRLEDMRTSQIRAALGKAGVDPRVQGAAVHTILGEGLVQITDEGKILYRKPNEFGGMDESTVEAGITEYLKGDGRIFMPADPVRGTGGQGGPNGAPFRPDSNQGGQEADPESIALRALAGH